MGKSAAKGLVLACVFMNCYVPKRDMTVYQLLDADPRLNSRYGRHPKVLSNTLRRYYKQGLLYRYQGRRRGRRIFYYGMTEKGFERLAWLIHNRTETFPEDKDFMESLLERSIEHWKEKIAVTRERQRRYIIER